MLPVQVRWKWSWPGGQFGQGDLKKVASETYYGESPGLIRGKSVTICVMVVRTERGEKKGLLRRAIGVLF